jgi:DNA polymerase-3 subunit delta
MEYLRILRDIELKNLKPVYFLMGEESYFIDEITNTLEDKVLDEASKAFCQTIVYGRDVNMDQVVNNAKGFPMMGDKQVLIVKESQDMKEWKSRKKDAEETEFKSILAYLQNPTPSTILVFNYKGKFDKRKKIYKLFEKQGVVFESERIKDYKLSDWIEKYVVSKGFKINHTAAQLLADYLGSDLSKVVNAVNKLSIVLHGKGEITPELIEQNIGISKDYNVFELTNALGQKDILKSNRIIAYFEANPKSNPIQLVLPMMYSYFSRLAAFMAIPDKRMAASELGINPYALNEFKAAAANYSPQKVERIISYLRETDKKSKGVDNVSADSGELMKELVFKILH